MINTSNEYKQIIASDNRKLYHNATITLFDGTILSLDNSKLCDIKIDDAVSQSGSFTLGSAIINKLTLSINNIYDAYSDYDFTGAIIRPSVGLQLSNTIETLPKGVFTSDDPKAIGSVINISALDNMAKFDRPFKGITIVFPTTAQLLLNAICLHCGVVLATNTFFNSDYIIQARPDDEAINCREVVSWIATISGNNARCNNQGALELKWFDMEAFSSGIDGGYFDNSTPYASGDDVDGGNFNDYSSGDNADGGTFVETKRFHHIYTTFNRPNVATDDVVITGIQVTYSSEAPSTVLFGSSGYIISIEGNKLIQSQSDAVLIANSVGAKIVGMRFRPLSLTALSDPSREAGDIAYVSDRKGNTYQTLITHCAYSAKRHDRIDCDAEPPARNSSVRYSETAKAINEAKKNTEKQLTAYDLMVKQLNDLVAHSFGVYKSEEVLPDGSIIYYMHDKPTRIESMKIWKQTSDAFAVSTDGGATYTAGFDINGNAVFNILSAIGINADWIRLGKLLSNDGSTLIDMAYGVANSDNLSFTDNIQNGYSLIMPFNIDDNVSKINKVLLKFTQQPFRTYSTTASSGGGATQTSNSGGGGTSTTKPHSSVIDTEMATQLIMLYDTSLSTGNSGAYSGNTGISTPPPTDTAHNHTFSVSYHSHSIGSHSHEVLTAGHYHKINFGHSHGVDLPDHTHDVYVPNHTHTLNFGIQEQSITNNEISIYVDGAIKSMSTDLQGIIDLTAHITTTGWHAIEIQSTTLKRVSAQINIKSYIKS